MDLMDVVTVAAEVVAGASVAALGLAKVFPKVAKFGPVLSVVHKVLSFLAMNHKAPEPKDPGPPVRAVQKVKLVKDPKTGKVVSTKVSK